MKKQVCILLGVLMIVVIVSAQALAYPVSAAVKDGSLYVNYAYYSETDEFVIDIESVDNPYPMLFSNLVLKVDSKTYTDLPEIYSGVDDSVGWGKAGWGTLDASSGVIADKSIACFGTLSFTDSSSGTSYSGNFKFSFMPSREFQGTENVTMRILKK